MESQKNGVGRKWGERLAKDCAFIYLLGGSSCDEPIKHTRKKILHIICVYVKTRVRACMTGCHYVALADLELIV